MWLLPFFSLIANTACRVFYRLRVAGPKPPRRGPVLLVANHPNALLDPACVVAAARRPVRFLGKSPLFDDPLLGWLVRGVGTIPVYRRMDDPAQMARNREMFRAAHEALQRGAAIGLFPEGTSHDDPELKPLKTGAARIALGAAHLTGAAFPIVPVGLVLRGKDLFRSEALIVLGDPIEWQDLASRREDDVEAVRELTERIDAALRKVTINLERWEDGPLLECAQAVWEAHAPTADEPARSALADPGQRVRRLEIATRMLADWREQPLDDPGLVRELVSHTRRLSSLGLSPALLANDIGLKAGMRWTAQRLYLLALPAIAAAAAGWALFLIPYHLTAGFTALARPIQDQTATYKVLIGALVYLVWMILLAVLGGVVVSRGLGGVEGAVAAAVVLVAVPMIGLLGLWLREHWRGATGDLRGFFLLRSRRRLVERLQRRQTDLATRISRLVADSNRNGGG